MDLFNDSDILCAYGTHVPSNINLVPNFLNGFDILSVPAVKEKTLGRASGGLALFFRKNMIKIKVINSCKYWLFTLIHLKNVEFIIGFVYFKPTIELEFVLENLDDVLIDLKSKFCNHAIVVGGDFNCRVGELNTGQEELFEGTHLNFFRNSLDKRINTKGKLLLEFMEQHSLILINGRSPSDKEGNFTFASHLGTSTPDLIWCDCQHLELILDLKIHHILTISDHFPLILKMNVSTDGGVENRVTAGSGESYTRILKWDVHKGPEFSDIMRYSSLIATNFTNSIDDLFVNFKTAVYNSASQINMSYSVKLNGNKHCCKNLNKPWFDEECRQKKKTLKSLLKYCKISNFNELNKYNYIRTKNSYKNLLKCKKRKHTKNIIGILENCNNSKLFWSTIKRFRKSGSSNNIINAEAWEKFFTEIYPTRVIDDNDYFDVGHPVLDLPISAHDIRNAIRRTRSGTSPGLDNISYDFYKWLPDNWYLYFECLLNKIKNLK